MHVVNVGNLRDGNGAIELSVCKRKQKELGSRTLGNMGAIFKTILSHAFDQKIAPKKKGGTIKGTSLFFNSK